LRRQTKLVPNLLIDQLLQRKLRGTLFPKGHFSNGVTGLIKDLQGLFERRLLRFIRKQFDLKCCFHSDTLHHEDHTKQLSSYIERFPPALNGGASALVPTREV